MGAHWLLNNVLIGIVMLLLLVLLFQLLQSIFVSGSAGAGATFQLLVVTLLTFFAHFVMRERAAESATLRAIRRTLAEHELGFQQLVNSVGIQTKFVPNRLEAEAGGGRRHLAPRHTVRGAVSLSLNG